MFCWLVQIYSLSYCRALWQNKPASDCDYSFRVWRSSPRRISPFFPLVFSTTSPRKRQTVTKTPSSHQPSNELTSLLVRRCSCEVCVLKFSGHPANWMQTLFSCVSFFTCFASWHQILTKPVYVIFLVFISENNQICAAITVWLICEIKCLSLLHAVTHSFQSFHFKNKKLCRAALNIKVHPSLFLPSPH